MTNGFTGKEKIDKEQLLGAKERLATYAKALVARQSNRLTRPFCDCMRCLKLELLAFAFQRETVPDPSFGEVDAIEYLAASIQVGKRVFGLLRFGAQCHYHCRHHFDRLLVVKYNLIGQVDESNVVKGELGVACLRWLPRGLD